MKPGPPPWNGSPALWNRASFDLRSDEILAQVLDRGTLDDWRELYRMAARDPELRARILRVLSRVPLPYPHFWLAALANLGESVDFKMKLPTEDWIA